MSLLDRLWQQTFLKNRHHSYGFSRINHDFTASVSEPAHGRRLGFEVKFQDAPTTTKSMHIALSDLKLDRLFVVYPGVSRFPLTDKIECLPFTEIASEVSA